MMIDQEQEQGTSGEQTEQKVETVIATGARIRKSTVKSDYVTNDEEAIISIREYNKQKIVQDAQRKAKRKRQEQEQAEAAKATIAELQKKPKASRAAPPVKPLNAKQREEFEREENLLKLFNERLAHYTMYRTHKLREDTWEAKSVSEAIRSGIRQGNTLLLDWTHPEVNKIGSLCKVYWDGERNWFYARILNYDRIHNRHLVFYDLDHTAEWIVFENECAMLGEGLILQKFGNNVFPAIYFSSTPKGEEQNSRRKNYKKGAYYVEFWTVGGKNEWDFYYASQMCPIEDKYMPARITTGFEMRLKLAQEEHEKSEAVVREVLAATAKSVFKVLRGPDWIGLRVRALAHRLVKYGESEEQAVLDGVAKCEGTIVSYCGPTDEHFVVFDNPLLQATWIRGEPSSIDVLIGPTEVSCKRTQQLLHQRKTTPGVFASEPICCMCGLGEIISTDTESDLKPGETEKVDSVDETGMGEEDSSSSVPMETHQRVSRLVNRDFFETIATSGASVSRQPKKATSSSMIVSTSSAPPTALNTCKSCHTHYHTMCLPIQKLNWPLADIELVDGLCWACIRCRGGCGSSAFDTCLIPWSLRRAHEWAPDERKPTCGACVSKYLIEKEFCNVCYKTYPTELSMAPTLDALVVAQEPQIDDRGTAVNLKSEPIGAEDDPLDADIGNLEYIPYDSSSMPNSVRSSHIFIHYFTEEEFSAKSSIQKFPRPLQGQPSDADNPVVKASSRKGWKRGKKRKAGGARQNSLGEQRAEEGNGEEEVGDGDGEVDEDSADKEENDNKEEALLITRDLDNPIKLEGAHATGEVDNVVMDVIDPPPVDLPVTIVKEEKVQEDVAEESNMLNASMNSVEFDDSRMVSVINYYYVNIFE